MTTVVLLSGTSFTIPGDFSSSNSIECIGGGGAGKNSNITFEGSGGGGGEYRKLTNLAGLSGTITYSIGAAGAHADPGGSGGDTWFNGTNLAASSVGSKGGLGGSDSAGGLGG